nr:uncharacterized protein LOC123570627 [Macaca fascicularis]
MPRAGQARGPRAHRSRHWARARRGRGPARACAERPARRAEEKAARGGGCARGVRGVRCGVARPGPRCHRSRRVLGAGTWGPGCGPHSRRGSPATRWLGAPEPGTARRCSCGLAYGRGRRSGTPWVRGPIPARSLARDSARGMVSSGRVTVSLFPWGVFRLRRVGNPLRGSVRLQQILISPALWTWSSPGPRPALPRDDTRPHRPPAWGSASPRPCPVGASLGAPCQAAAALRALGGGSQGPPAPSQHSGGESRPHLGWAAPVLAPSRRESPRASHRLSLMAVPLREMRFGPLGYCLRG